VFQFVHMDSPWAGARALLDFVRDGAEDPGDYEQALVHRLPFTVTACAQARDQTPYSGTYRELLRPLTQLILVFSAGRSFSKLFAGQLEGIP